MVCLRILERLAATRRPQLKPPERIKHDIRRGEGGGDVAALPGADQAQEGLYGRPCFHVYLTRSIGFGLGLATSGDHKGPPRPAPPPSPLRTVRQLACIHCFL